MMIFSPKTFRCAISIFLLTGVLMRAPIMAQQKDGLRVPQQVANEKSFGLRALFDGSGFVRIPAGEFMMGSAKGNNDDEKPVHRVRITRGFEMGKFEVTQAQWEAVMESKRDAHSPPEKANAAAPKNESGKESNPSYFKGPTLPVENVSWDEVQEFLRALNALDGKHHYRLPTEAEWEYAARAGSKNEYAGDLETTVWYQANSNGRTRPVGGKKPNAWGLFDMYGNVLEWVQDWYGYYPIGRVVADPQGAEPGSYRVYRGCSWYSSAADCRAAFRSFDLPANYYYSLGFRLVRTPK